MIYLFLEILVWIVAAFILGWFARGFFCCRKEQESETTNESQAVATSSTVVSHEEIEVVAVEWKPQGFTSAPDDSDDLKRIKGIGQVIETTLNELGIYQFKQISIWDSNNISWLENFLAFPGRINRENWVEQAKTLNEGGTTEFAKRVDKGDVNYKK